MYSVNKKNLWKYPFCGAQSPQSGLTKFPVCIIMLIAKAAEPIRFKFVQNMYLILMQEDIWASCLVTSHPDIVELPFFLPCVCLMLKFNYHRINLLTLKH